LAPLERCRYPDTVITAAGMVDEPAVMIAAVVAAGIMSVSASRGGK
jgi:predicted tellurium resistance membrane protein TerC